MTNELNLNFNQRLCCPNEKPALRTKVGLLISQAASFTSACFAAT